MTFLRSDYLQFPIYWKRDRDLHQSLIAERTLLFTDAESDKIPDLLDAFNTNKKQTTDRYENTRQ